MTSGRRLYLAYGSNLSRAQMRDRCLQAMPIAEAVIHGWRLAFFGKQTKRWGPGGVATLLPEAGARAYGALYELTAVDEARMDGYESYPSFYCKRDDFTACLESVDLAPADVVFVYLKNDLSFPNPPAHKYIETIRRGFADWSLPLDALASIKPLT